ncbi:unnamed protein product, partial [Rotaria sp. Silwood2]
KISFILIVLVLLVPFVIEEFVQRREWGTKFCIRVVRYLITGIIVFVISVSDSLLLTATISLEYVVKKMIIDNNLVRHLLACETTGNVTTLCCNKTGLLTTNRMTVVQVYVGEKHWKNVEDPAKVEEIILLPHIKESIIEDLSVNSSYSSKLLSPTEEDTLPQQVGNKNECSLLGFVGALDGNYDEIRTRYPEEKFVHIYKFNSVRKSASEIILKKCTTILNHNGEVIPFSTADYDRLVQTVIEPMASNGLRTICLAYRDFSSHRLPDWNDETSVVDQLTCICICGIEDPIRSEIPDVIAKCRNAGITVRMITGDNVNTARSIALKCGIISHNDNASVLENQEFNRLIRSKTDGEVKQNLLDKVWPHLRVLARSSPQDKYILVRGIMASRINPAREIVAVTANGTNDIPSLKIADVGFAMGIQGTDVAKEASDIILVDDNLVSIVKAVMWSRNFYDSIAKSLQFQLTVKCPLRDIHMLWIYLTMNIFASLIFVFNVPTEDILTRKPYGCTRPLISRRMMKNIVGHAIYQLTVILFILSAGPTIFSIGDGRPVDSIFKSSEHFTIIFNVFILMNLFNEINYQQIHGEKNVFHTLSKNSIFYGIWIFTFVAQIALVHYGSLAFSCVALTFKQWIWCLLLGASVLPWNQVTIFSFVLLYFITNFICFRWLI